MEKKNHHWKIKIEIQQQQQQQVYRSWNKFSSVSPFRGTDEHIPISSIPNHQLLEHDEYYDTPNRHRQNMSPLSLLIS